MSMIGNYLTLSLRELDAIIVEPGKAEELAYPESGDLPVGSLDIDKAWHLIHYLLNGEAWGGEGPLANAVLGGTELEGTDAGYGPFRYLLPADVRATAQALSLVNPEELWTRFDAAQVSADEIYPVGWTGDQEEREYVLHNYMAVQRFFAEAAASSKAILLYLS